MKRTLDSEIIRTDYLRDNIESKLNELVPDCIDLLKIKEDGLAQQCFEKISTLWCLMCIASSLRFMSK